MHDKATAIKRLITGIYFTSITLYALTPSMVEAADIDDCKSKYNSFISNNAYTSNEKIKRFEELSGECSKSGLYEHQLAKLYFDAGRYDDAKKTLLSGLSYKTDFDKELKSDLVDAYVALGNYKESENIANSLITDYENWYGGYYALGEMRLLNRRFREGIEYLEKSNSLQSSQGAYLMLVIAYHQIDEHKKAVSSMKSAIEFGDTAFFNRGAVISTAYSLIALNRLQDAKAILAKHQKMTSGSENDPGFIRVVMYLKKKIDEITASNGGGKSK